MGLNYTDKPISSYRGTKKRNDLKELILTDDISLYWRKARGGRYVVELHDFANLRMYANTVSAEDFNNMRVNPEKYL